MITISSKFSTSTVKYSKNYKIGFIGLGNMGYGMASNLYTKLNPDLFSVYDVSKDSSLKFVSNHKSSEFPVKIADSIQELAKQSNVIITMLPMAKHVRQVLSSIKDIVAPGTMFIDSSTIDPDSAKWMAALCSEKQCMSVDAPVSGGTPGANSGTLTFMVGSKSNEEFEKFKPILACMGKNIVYCGDHGNGQVAKICNNMMLGISMIAASETMNLGMKLGMDPKLLSSILSTSTGRCWSIDSYNPVPNVMPNVPSSRDYTGGFGNQLIAKDLGLAVDAAKSSKSVVILGSMANEIYKKISTTSGYEQKDFSSVYKWIKN